MGRTAPRLALALAVALTASGAAGCGGRRHVEVTGRVTYNGAPLDRPGGRIVFVGGDAEQVVTPLGTDGTYQAAGVPTGPNRVAVYYPNPEAERARATLRPRKGEPPRRAPPVLPPPFLTPYQYAAVDTSGLSVQVRDGTVFDADLSGPKIP